MVMNISIHNLKEIVMIEIYCGNKRMYYNDVVV